MNIKQSIEYQLINEYYGNQIAKRSKVRYMDHIDDALEIFDLLNASNLARRAFCIHPMLQPDDALAKNWQSISLKCKSPVILLAMEYRHIAMSYLSQRKIESIDEIKLSPIKDVNDMLSVDKIQNKKDFMIHHYGNHERSKELLEYFNNWIDRLNVTGIYNEYAKLYINIFE